MSRLLRLNPAQEKAVSLLDDNVLILAGAGSGKTRIITEKFVRLVKERGVSPYAVIAITFTNKAALEMRSRIDRKLEGKYPSLNVRTFHSFGAWLLRLFIENIGYQKNFTIIDTEDQNKIIKEIVKSHLYGEEIETAKVYSKIITKLKNDLYEWSDSSRDLPSHYHLEDLEKEDIFLVYRLYQEHLKDHNLVDFDDLLILPGKLLESSLLVKSFVRDRYRYLLIDEYQDVNLAQEKMIENFSHLGLIVNAVGDEDQCIYSFRGSRIENIFSFEDKYASVKVVKLEENYRSTKSILNLANEIISHNQRLYPKKLFTQNEEGTLPSLKYFIQKKEEGNDLVKEIERLKNQGYSYHDMAVLYRLNSVSRFVEEALVHRGIPYEIHGDVKFYKRKEIKDVLSYLAFLYNPRDSNAFSRIINYPKRSLGDKTQEKIIAFMSANVSNKENFLEKYEQGLRVDTISKKSNESFHDFMMSLISLKKELPSLKIDEIVIKIIERFQIIEDMEKIKETNEREKKKDNLKELINSCIEYVKYENEASLENYMMRIGLQMDQLSGEEKGSCVNLMTAHNAKGLEFPVVFIVGMEDGVFPHYMNLEEDYLLEEERRLFYVAVTRAKKELIISCSIFNFTYGGVKQSLPSRFLESLKDSSLIKISSDLDISQLSKSEHEYF